MSNTDEQNRAILLAIECGSAPTAPFTARFTQAQFFEFCRRHREVIYNEIQNAVLEGARQAELTRAPTGAEVQGVEGGENKPAQPLTPEGIQWPAPQEVSQFIRSGALTLDDKATPPLAVQQVTPSTWAIVDGRGVPIAQGRNTEGGEVIDPFTSLLWAGLVAERIRVQWNGDAPYWVSEDGNELEIHSINRQTALDNPAPKDSNPN